MDIHTCFLLYTVGLLTPFFSLCSKAHVDDRSAQLYLYLNGILSEIIYDEYQSPLHLSVVYDPRSYEINTSFFCIKMTGASLESASWNRVYFHLCVLTLRNFGGAQAYVKNKVLFFFSYLIFGVYIQVRNHVDVTPYSFVLTCAWEQCACVCIYVRFAFDAVTSA